MFSYSYYGSEIYLKLKLQSTLQDCFKVLRYKKPEGFKQYLPHSIDSFQFAKELNSFNTINSGCNKVLKSRLFQIYSIALSNIDCNLISL